MDRYLFDREYAFIRRSFGVVAQPRGLLEIGCGSGRVTLPLHNAGFHIVGLDSDPVALAAFRRRSNAVPLVMGDALRLPFADDSFDCVVAIQSLLYFDHRRFLEECHRILRSDGLLVFDFVNQRSYKWPLKKLFGRVLSFPSINLDCREVLGAVADHGFNIQEASGFNWMPFTRDSDNALVGAAALVERTLRLDRYYSISPWILVAAKKKERV